MTQMRNRAHVPAFSYCLAALVPSGCFNPQAAKKPFVWRFDGPARRDKGFTVK